MGSRLAGEAIASRTLSTRRSGNFSSGCPGELERGFGLRSSDPVANTIFLFCKEVSLSWQGADAWICWLAAYSFQLAICKMLANIWMSCVRGILETRMGWLVLFGVTVVLFFAVRRSGKENSPCPPLVVCFGGLDVGLPSPIWRGSLDTSWVPERPFSSKKAPEPSWCRVPGAFWVTQTTQGAAPPGLPESDSQPNCFLGFLRFGKKRIVGLSWLTPVVFFLSSFIFFFCHGHHKKWKTSTSVLRGRQQQQPSFLVRNSLDGLAGSHQSKSMFCT